ncbi:ribosome maturation factor RimP [Thermomonospora cellulosilytica]|uniref:Ribosome maturation factor RimP n=1 Tax=Thermomonospora cellulosilytica TaxID=1411118 RepID=A0A7W3N3Q6_9ACTN|nr:ribosome maturation factor RimP [Thermomonospora cellulosilytica]MBA9006998.1 ribosome maturation factor RimP [Thermomonospora cellulosilytica]
MSVESGRGRARRASSRPERRAPGGGASRAELVAELTRLVAPLAAAEGMDLEEVDVRPAGRRRLVRIVVDADGGVSLDDVATLNQAVSARLDETDLMGTAPYVLEVTSPGVDRPLTEPRHWRRAVGRLVRTALADGGQVEGRVVAADDDAVVLEVAGRRRRFGHGELGRGRVQVEFRRAEGTAPADGEASDDELADLGADEAGN